MTDAQGATKRRRRRPPPVDAEKSAKESDAKPPAKPKKAKGADKPKSADVPIFDTAKHQNTEGFGKVPDLQRGFQTVTNDLFESGYDVVKEWGAIRKALIIKDALTPERLKRAANEAEDVANRAHQLYIIAKVEVAAYMRETEAIHGAIRESAIQTLEAQKANKTRTKQITDADVVSEAARLHPDEWSDICTRRDRASAMLRHLENLKDLARSRCYTISNMSMPGNRGV